MDLVSLAYSPCPNDTFLFYHLVHETISSKFKVKEELHDVEELNLSAKQNKFNVTKLSFFAFFHFINHYTLLNSGSALGHGCGPILVKKKNKKIGKLNEEKILVPGILTTANLLLQIYLKQKLNTTPIRYDLIMQKILDDEFNLGVIIHEERFTFEEKGLEKVVDLGEFWESYSNKPIPLGAIAIQKKIPNEMKIEFDNSLKKSLELGYKFPEKAKNYILENSQVKDLKIVNSHIELYVNEYTKDLGKIGKDAVLFLFEESMRQGLIQNQKNLEDIFL